MARQPEVFARSLEPEAQRLVKIIAVNSKIRRPDHLPDVA